MVKGESSAVEGVSHKSQAQRLCAYRLKLKCALSTRGAKCFLLSSTRGRRRSGAEGWGGEGRRRAPLALANLYPVRTATNLCSLEKLQYYTLSGCQSPSLSPSVCLSLLTHGHGTIYEAFPSETHCKIYFRFIYARNARRNNHTVAKGRGSDCVCVCV